MRDIRTYPMVNGLSVTVNYSAGQCAFISDDWAIHILPTDKPIDDTLETLIPSSATGKVAVKQCLFSN